MSSSDNCSHDCATPQLFPAEIDNRPALPTIDYRIGDYNRMREHMLAQLNCNVTLAQWTHRGADDPGIALLETNAIVGDILTFYQSLYANEAYLRTAKWESSVQDLISLTGYRLAPRLAGEGYFTLEIDGDIPVEVPAGFGVKAQLEGREKADEFESDMHLTAYPHLSKFHLYRRANAAQSIETGHQQLEIETAHLPTDIKAGDRILLMPSSGGGLVLFVNRTPEIVIVKAVETRINRTVITFEGSLARNRGNSVKAYLINRTFKHFGYQAGSTYSVHQADEVTVKNTSFARTITTNHGSTDMESGFNHHDIPLDMEVDDLAAGSQLIFSSHFAGFVVAGTGDILEVRTVNKVSANTYKWGNIEAPASLVTLDEPIFEDDGSNSSIDIRRTRIYEAISPEFTLHSISEFPSYISQLDTLDFYGTFEEALTLCQRAIILQHQDSLDVEQHFIRSEEFDIQAQLGTRDMYNAWRWQLELTEPTGFSASMFDDEVPAIDVFGNVLHVTQGKTEDEAAIGDGDNRAIFQTFPLPKKDLTFNFDDSQTPAHVPDLLIYVNNILWAQVETFFAQSDDAQVYVVRSDESGQQYIQFGDGINGARLPTGKKNVVAKYRTGTGAVGLLEEGQKPKATSKLKPVKQVWLPGEVLGGSEAELAENARQASPDRLQSLNRLVSLQDYEAETLMLSGVLKAKASWEIINGSPLINLVVLTDNSFLTKSTTDASVDYIRDILSTYQRSRGANRHAISVYPGYLEYIQISLRVGIDSRYQAELIEAKVHDVLGTIESEEALDQNEGLCSLKNLGFGDSLHVSQVLGTVQNIEGVIWVEADEFSSTNSLLTQSYYKSDINAASQTFIASTSHSILALNADDLTVSIAFDQSTKSTDSLSDELSNKSETATESFSHVI